MIRGREREFLAFFLDQTYFCQLLSLIRGREGGRETEVGGTGGEKWRKDLVI